MGSPRKSWEISKFPLKSGIVGFHLTLWPQEVPVEARLAQAARERGIRLTSRELTALRGGRLLGIASIRRILDATASGFSPMTKQKLSEKIADAILDTSLDGQMSDEAPHAGDRAARDLALTLGNAGSPLATVPLGATLTVHWGRE